MSDFLDHLRDTIRLRPDGDERVRANVEMGLSLGAAELIVAKVDHMQAVAGGAPRIEELVTAEEQARYEGALRC